MNEYDKALMAAPSVEGDCCAVCGRFPAEKHHVVFRSRGGANGAVIPLCGFGNTSGCHGLAHSYRLHFRYRDGWEYFLTDEPAKYEMVLDMDGWKRL